MIGRGGKTGGGKLGGGKLGGEKVLAQVTADDGTVVAGTRRALHLGERAVPWEQVEAADWDADEFLLRVSEVGSWGEVRPAHEFKVSEPGRILELIRERVTASVLLQRHIPIRGRQGVRVIARRAPGSSALVWMLEYDDGIDPDDPGVRAAAADALQRAQGDVGL